MGSVLSTEEADVDKSDQKKHIVMLDLIFWVTVVGGWVGREMIVNELQHLNDVLKN